MLKRTSVCAVLKDKIRYPLFVGLRGRELVLEGGNDFQRRLEDDRKIRSLTLIRANLKEMFYLKKHTYFRSFVRI